MAILNPSFEDAGALPGEAEHWALSAVTSLEEIAGFGTAPEDAWEDFERWFELLDSIDDVVVVLAFFDSALKGYDEFESGWANVVYLYDLPPAQLVTATFDGLAVEECETGWSNVPYAREWADVTAATGVFDGEPREDFEDLILRDLGKPCACEICKRAAIIEEGTRLTRAEAVELAAMRPVVTDVAIEAAGIAYGERPWWSVDGVTR